MTTVFTPQAVAEATIVGGGEQLQAGLNYHSRDSGSASAVPTTLISFLSLPLLFMLLVVLLR